MANVVTGNPISLDTQAVANVSPFGTSRIRIRHIEYTDYAVATELFELQDSEGRTVWSGNGNADFSPVVSQEIGWVKGLSVQTLVAPGRFLVFI